ncbi:hypothetical protein GCM10017044_17750 [Kordiimonas sediminis]|uniref:DUF3667 domain-containing protein n=1 Tax=Kordiimonas sediminis TaxID=1735581 RepID=A0A919AS63_9PROT|nr:DUF3667 domain-containing protein [Kordiimonas sediminis]GHF23635.1 hypothetical protein GCM10017044_17750 [Kordiimonas sediminis]
MKKVWEDLLATVRNVNPAKRDQYRKLKEKVTSPDYNAGDSCMNCGTELSGPFCHVCGQRDNDLRRPLWTFVRDMLDDLLSTDSRVLKSILMLILVPGGLTRSFMMGRRARYVPPLRLYLVISVTFFLALSILQIAIIDINVAYNEEKAAALAAETSEPDQKAEEGSSPPPESEMPPTSSDEQAEGQPDPAVGSATAMQQDPKTAVEAEATDREQRSKPDTRDPKEVIEEAQRLSREALLEVNNTGGISPEMEERLKRIRGAEDIPGVSPEDFSNSEKLDLQLGTFPYDIDVGMFVPITDEPREGLRQEDIDQIIEGSDQTETVKKLTAGFSKGLQDPAAFNDMFNDWLPRALFVLMPVFALILRVFHWGAERNYVNQLVFSLHFHSFLFILLMAMMYLLPKVGGQKGFDIFWIVTSLYLIIALKIGQNQGFIRAFIKAGFVYMSYLILMGMTLMFVVYQGLQEL